MYFDPGDRPAVMRIRVIWVAIALSLALHGVALWEWLPRLRPLTVENPVEGQSNSAIVAQLAQRPSPPATTPAPSNATTPAAARPPPRPPPPRAAPKASPPVLTSPVPAPVAVLPAPPSTPAPPAPPAPPTTAVPRTPPTIAGDLSSYIEARRRARGEPSTSAVDGSVAKASPTPDNDIERRNRIVAANLGTSKTPTFGGDARNSGGVFHVERLNYNDAQFLFNGWNTDIGRKSVQHIEVRRGENSDIRYAVIRKMIAIIREHESGDFVWVSPRLGRELTLSARGSDNGALEAFMLKEFFAEWRPEVGAK